MDAETIVEYVKDILKDKEETINLKKQQLECLSKIRTTHTIFFVGKYYLVK